MIQDIAPQVFHNEYRAGAAPGPEDLAVFYGGGTFLLRAEQGPSALRFPRFDEPGVRAAMTEPFYLFSIDGRGYYASWRDVCYAAAADRIEERLAQAAEQETPAPEGAFSRWRLNDLRRGGIGPRSFVFAAFTAYHLLEWYRAGRFCGACGSRTVLDGRERALVCPQCGAKVYPRINPAVIIGVRNGEKLLIARYQGRRTTFNALIAGFTEIGETLEETVAREVMEEAGLRVKNIRYYKSQPWGVAQDVLMGFFCDVDGDDTIHRDDTELQYAEWVPRGEIELQPTDYSLTNEMMRVFRDGLDG